MPVLRGSIASVYREILFKSALDLWPYFGTKFLWLCELSIFVVFPLFAAFLFSAIVVMLSGLSGLYVAMHRI